MSYRKVFVKAAAENASGKDPVFLIPFTKENLVARDTVIGQAGGALGGATAGGVGGLILGGMAGNKITEWLSENRNPSASVRILGTLLGSGIGGFGGLALGGYVGGKLGGSYTGHKGAETWDAMRNAEKELNKLGSCMESKGCTKMMTYKLLNKRAADNRSDVKKHILTSVAPIRMTYRDALVKAASEYIDSLEKSQMNRLKDRVGTL